MRDLRELAGAFQAVADRHDLLRARAWCEERRWRLEVRPAGAVRASGWLRRVAVAGLDPAARREAVAAAGAAATARLDPAAGVMAQAVWFDAGPRERGWLLIVIHHLAVDGVSWRILLPDLAAAWQAEGLEPVPVSFRRWAGLLAARRPTTRLAERELPGWREVLARPDPALGGRRLDPETDHPRTRRSLSVQVPAQVSAGLLAEVPAAFHAGVNDALLAGLAVAVGWWRRRQGWSDGTAVLADVEGHGRDEDLVPGHGPVQDGGLVHQHVPGQARSRRGGLGRRSARAARTRAWRSSGSRNSCGPSPGTGPDSGCCAT